MTATIETFEVLPILRKGTIMIINETVSLRPAVRLRWLTIACFEIQIGDFAIVIDPCVGVSTRAPFGAEVIEKADVILLSHAHWDHTTDIKYVMDKFGCPLLCPELSAPSVLRMLDCNPNAVYPISANLELDFGGAKIRGLFGRHTNQKKTLAELTERVNSNPVIDTPEMKEANFFGHLEYRNYLITAPSGLKILFWGNNATPEQLNIMRELKPDIAILQFTGQRPEEVAAMVKAGGAKVLIPHHMDLKKDDDVYAPLLVELEKTVHETSPDCLMITPERLKWYNIGFQVSAE